MKTAAALTEKRRFWQQHVQQARLHSGSLADYAKQYQLNANTLYYWVGKLEYKTPIKKSDSEPVSFSAVQVSLPAPAPAPAPAPTTHYSLQLSPRATLHFTVLPDPQWLAELCRQMDVYA
jgi:transposase-like protein